MKEAHPDVPCYVRRQTWSHWPAYPPTEDEKEQLLLELWFRVKEHCPAWPYNAHDEHLDFGKCLWVVVNALRLYVHKHKGCELTF